PSAMSSDAKTKTERLLVLPKMPYAWDFKFDISPDGRHTVYTLEEKSGDQFVLDGKVSPKFESLLGPWFDDDTGILVYKEGKPRKWRWHIGEQVHDAYEQTDNPVFSPDGKHHCYAAKKGGK